MYNVCVAVFKENPKIGEELPLVGKGRRSPPSSLVVELVEAIWTCSPAVAGGNILHLKKVSLIKIGIT